MSTTKDLVVSILRAIAEEPKTLVEIAKATSTTESFASWIINGNRYGDLFTKNTPNGYNPSLISLSEKGVQQLQDYLDQKETLL